MQNKIVRRRFEELREKESREFKIFASISMPILAAVCGFGYLCDEAYMNRSNYIPRQNEVQRDYAIPTGIKIRLEDLDGNGEQETIFSYDKRDYLLKIDSIGRPIIQNYKKRNTESVPKE